MDHIGRETKIKVGGKEYTLSRYTRAILSKVVDWATARLPHPLDAVKSRLEGFPPHLQERLVDEAIESAKSWGSINNPHVQNEINSIDGVLLTTKYLLEKHHPGINEDEVFDLFTECSTEHGDEYLGEAIARAMGVHTVKKEEDEDSKKKDQRKRTGKR